MKKVSLYGLPFDIYWLPWLFSALTIPGFTVTKEIFVLPCLTSPLPVFILPPLKLGCLSGHLCKPHAKWAILTLKSLAAFAITGPCLYYPLTLRNCRSFWWQVGKMNKKRNSRFSQTRTFLLPHLVFSDTEKWHRHWNEQVYLTFPATWLLLTKMKDWSLTVFYIFPWLLSIPLHWIWQIPTNIFEGMS